MPLHLSARSCVRACVCGVYKREAYSVAAATAAATTAAATTAATAVIPLGQELEMTDHRPTSAILLPQFIHPTRTTRLAMRYAAVLALLLCSGQGELL